MVEFVPTPIALLFVVSALVILLLGIYILLNPRMSWSHPTTRTLLFVLAASILWTGPYALHLIAVDLTWKLHWFNLTHVGASLLVPALLLHVSTYAGYYDWFTRPRLALLAVEPSATAVLVATEPYHALLRTDVTLVSVGATAVIHRGIGPWWFIRSTYLYLLMLVVFLVLLVAYRRASWLVRRQLIAGAVAIGTPVVVNMMFDLQFLGAPPVPSVFFQVELTSVALGVSGIVLSYSVVRYRYLDLAFVGRRIAIDHLRDPYVVIDGTQRIVDHNPRFRELVGAATTIFGEDIHEHMPEIGTLLGAETGTKHEIPLANGKQRWFEVHLLPIERSEESPWEERVGLRLPESLPGRRSAGQDTAETNGQVLVFREITARKRHEAMLEAKNEQLELLNRIVSHDIHNEMDLALGLTRRVQSHLGQAGSAQELPADTDEYLKQVVQSSNRVVELTETARGVVEALEEMDSDLEPVELKPVLEQELLYAMSYDDVTVAIENEAPDVVVQANEMLSSVFRNLLRNAIIHNDKSHPHITISTELRDDRIVIDIADNGPGIPPEQRRAVLEEVDGSISGFGLYLVRMLMEQYEGDVGIDENDTGGATVSVEFQTLDI